MLGPGDMAVGKSKSLPQGVHMLLGTQTIHKLIQIMRIQVVKRATKS